MEACSPVPGDGFGEIGLGNLAILLANSLLWLGLGILVFKRMENLARNRGLLFSDTIEKPPMRLFARSEIRSMRRRLDVRIQRAARIRSTLQIPGPLAA